MSITQTELAKRLGVSQAAVSLAFSAGHNRLSESTRSRILDAAEKLDYRHNRLASGLRSGRTSSVGLVWPVSDPWAGDAVIALDLLGRLQARQFAVYHSPHSESVEVLCNQLDDLLARRAEAIVIQAIPSQLRDPEVVKRLEGFSAAVAVSREDVPELPCDLLIHDRDQAVRDVVDYLVATGRRRPAMAVAMAEEANPPKFEAFRQRCRHHGLEPHANLLIDLPLAKDPTRLGQSHADGIRQQLGDSSAGDLPDAIFCFNDVGALFVMSELQDRGLRVPDDVAVIGFNNMEAGLAARPPLASGDRRPHDVADGIERMLTARLKDPELAPQRQTVHMRFIWRESAGPERT